MKTIAVRRLTSRDVRGLVVVSLGHGSNDGKLRRVIDWIICHSDHKHFHLRLLTAIHQISESER